MTTATLTQAELDAQAYDTYVRNGENRAATARELGIGATTAYDRIKRHQARAAQDALADSHALDAEQAAQDAEYAADSEAAEQTPAELPDPVHHGDVFARIEASNPDMREMDETDAVLALAQPASEDPDESVAALLEDGEPEPAEAAPVPASADVLEQLIKARGAEYNDGTVPAPAQTRKPAARTSLPGLAVLPEGVITPGQFRDLLITEGLAGDELQSKTVCDWVKRAKGFPGAFYGQDGTVYDQQQKTGGKVTTRTGVHAADGVAWFRARAARKTQAA